MVHNMSFLPITNIKFDASKFEISSTLSAQEICAAVLQEEVSIVDEVLHNLPQMCKDG